MKRWLSAFLIITMILTAWQPAYASGKMQQFRAMNDPSLLRYVEEEIYQDTIAELVDDYVVTNVEAKYISQEYLDELAFNSQTNIFFGYSLEELDAQFEGTRYVFTLGDNNETVVLQFEKYDEAYEQIINNVAQGSGVIVLCLTLASVTSTVAPGISAFFVMTAQRSIINSLKESGVDFVIKSLNGFIQTGDIGEAIRSAAVSASTEFKCSAIMGSIAGAAKSIPGFHTITPGPHLNFNQIKIIQKVGKYSLDFIQSINSMDEYNVYKDAGLKEYLIGDKHVLIPENFDFEYIDPVSGYSNRVLMENGNNPVSTDGIEYEWHYVGQNQNAPVALLTETQYQMNYEILYPTQKNDLEWEKTRKKLNKLVSGYFADLS